MPKTSPANDLNDAISVAYYDYFEENNCAPDIIIHFSNDFYQQCKADEMGELYFNRPLVTKIHRFAGYEYLVTPEVTSGFKLIVSDK